MATLYSKGTGGNWSTLGTFNTLANGTGTDTIPTGGSGGDDVVIQKNHTVTLNDTTCVCKSLKIEIGTTGSDVGGKLIASTTANSKLQVYQGILARGSTSGTNGSYSSTVQLDMSSASAYTCTIVYNDAQANTSSSTDPTAGGTFYVNGFSTFKGAPRTRWTYTQAALTADSTKSVVVDDATGWQVGDILVFATTQAYNATPRVDKVTIDTITPGTGTTATVTWIDGTGATGAVQYSHDTSCLVGNFTSNLRFVPTVANKPHGLIIAVAHGAMNTIVDNVEFHRCRVSTAFGSEGVLTFTSTATTPHIASNNAFYDPGYTALQCYSSGRAERTNNVYYAPTSMSAVLINSKSPTGVIGDDTDTCVFRHASTGATNGTYQMGAGTVVTRPKISGVTGNAAFLATGSYGDARIVQGGVWSSIAVDKRPGVSNGFISFEETYLGKGLSGHVYPSANNSYISQLSGAGSVDYVSCLENLSGGARADATVSNAGASETRFYNKNGDNEVQEINVTAVGYTTPVYTRTTSATKNANASIKFATLSSSTFKRTFSILVKGGVAATIHVWAKKSSTSFTTRPTAQLTGLGTSFSAVTMSDSLDTWELLDLSYSAASAPSADGILTLTLTAASTGASDTAHFSGIPIAPFVTRVRHYGYVVSETSPTLTVDTAIDPAISATTAAGYGGAGVGPVITWGTTVSTIATDADTTFKKLVHYTSAKMVDNVASVMPITWAGVYDAPAIFAQGNINISGDTLDGSGSLAMTGETAATGSMTLSADATADKFTRASGDFTTDGFAVGSVVTTSGFANAANNGTFTITALTATEMTVDAALTTETGSGNEEIVENTLLTATTPFSFTYGGGTYSRATGGDPAFSGGSLNIGAAAAGLTFTGDSLIISMTPTAPGTYEMGAGTFSGTIDLRNTSGTHAITVELPAGTSYITSNNRGATITVSTPSVERGLEFTGLVAGSFVKVFTTTTTTEQFSTLSSSTTETWDDATSGSLTVDYVIMKAGYLPIRVTGVTVTGAVGTGIQTVPISQTVDRSYVASSGLTWAEIALDTTSKYVKLNDTSTVQNLYSFMIEQWIDRGGVGATGAELANVKFPMVSNGPSGFSLIDGWETRGFTTAGSGIANTTLTNLYRDGLRYVDTGGIQTSVWAAILTSGVPTGKQVRYQQSDSGATVNALNTGNMDELVHVYGDASHGNFDKRGYLVLKVQAMEYDQAETDVVALYGNLEDQLYVVGLSPTPNGIATGNPSLATAPMITQGTYTEDGKTFSVKIVDGLTANSGENIMRWLRYNFETGGTFESEDAFNWHDLVQTNGSAFKTVRGTVYGTATTKGVLVYQNNGTSLHPDFTLFTADNGTTYAPPPTLTVNLSGFVSGTRIQIYDTANSVELFNDIVSATTKQYTETYTVNRTIRVRAAYVSGTSAKMFTEQNLGTLTSTVTSVSRDLEQVDDSVYNANGIDGSAVNTPDVIITITDATFLVSVDTGSISLPTIYAYQVYWLSTEEGIRDEGSFITATDTANYRFADFNIKNVSSPTAPLIITGGYATDFTTGDAIDIIDTTGGTIFLTPNHVIPYAAGAEATVAIVQSGLTAQGLTTTRAGKLDNLDMSIIASTQA